MIVIAAIGAGLLVSCASADEAGGGATPTPQTDSATPSASASVSASAMSPTLLPTLAQPTAPPSAPTDTTPSDLVAGRVTAQSDTCVEVTTDDDVVWSLLGTPEISVAAGGTVTVRIADLEPGDEPCGDGKPARLVSVRVVE